MNHRIDNAFKKVIEWIDRTIYNHLENPWEQKTRVFSFFPFLDTFYNARVGFEDYVHNADDEHGTKGEVLKSLIIVVHVGSKKIFKSEYLFKDTLSIGDTLQLHQFFEELMEDGPQALLNDFEAMLSKVILIMERDSAVSMVDRIFVNSILSE